MILKFKDREPNFHPSVWVAPDATVTGDVEVGKDSSIWFGAVIRGDVNYVRIGEMTSIQDLCVLHPALHPVLIGDEVTVGHRALLHGCTIGNRCLIGMGSIILDRARIGDECMVAAGALVTSGTVIPARTVVMGSPAKAKRACTQEELEGIRLGVLEYIQLARTYAAQVNINSSKPFGPVARK
jgi:carbonic anhydrase/acetyltransferase-like protein (isoleucine patch superfamily)